MYFDKLLYFSTLQDDIASAAVAKATEIGGSTRVISRSGVISDDRKISPLKCTGVRASDPSCASESLDTDDSSGEMSTFLQGIVQVWTVSNLLINCTTSVYM